MKLSFGFAAATLFSLASATIRTGFEVWDEAIGAGCVDTSLKYSMIINPTAVTRDLELEVDYLVRKKELNLVSVIGPEHGFRGAAQAGETVGGDIFDPVNGLKVIDGYSFRTGAQWAQAYTNTTTQVAVFDIQDAGARFYTYIWTMYDSMVGAALAGTKYIVLDRPNPIGGIVVDGGIMSAANASFVGRKPIAQQHGMTVGELALLFNNEYLPNDSQLQNSPNKKVDLQVVKMQGWSRDMFYQDTGLQWILPSPNMPTVDTAMVYPGMCLIEGTLISEGRGITKPFEIIGADFISDVPMKNWVDGLNALNLPGVRFRPQYFTPQGTQKLAGKLCGGVEVHITDRKAFRAVPTGIAVLCSLRDNFGSAFTYRTDNWFDNLSGSPRLRNLLVSGADYQTIVAGYQDELNSFLPIRNKYLLY
ncbi:hypothetical protein BB559_001040 [Furculomyces boomerangus]|uniref:DUF1343 domain-containing protein n=2 Tax=Harpellales TaxID=61421 RepID=A0A2T9Z3B8_9FUNG|nr:hypothetical protein BB559_001040 [Furculomyces boomerangus]PWA03413.1 hypothetical protein BB558_000424 [Smittium angustum]